MTGPGEAERALRAYYAGRIAERGARPSRDRRARERRDGRLSLALAAASFAAMAVLGLARLGEAPAARYGDGLAALIEIEAEGSAFVEAVGAINATWPRKD